MYSLAEIRIRSALKDNEQHIWNQKKKPTDNPTVRRVFMIFEGILLLYTTTGKRIEKHAMNIQEEHRIVLRCLGPAHDKIHFS